MARISTVGGAGAGVEVATGGAVGGIVGGIVGGVVAATIVTTAVDAHFSTPFTSPRAIKVAEPTPIGLKYILNGEVLTGLLFGAPLGLDPGIKVTFLFVELHLTLKLASGGLYL